DIDNLIAACNRAVSIHWPMIASVKSIVAQCLYISALYSVFQQLKLPLEIGIFYPNLERRIAMCLPEERRPDLTTVTARQAVSKEYNASYTTNLISSLSLYD
ncbi:MAG: hypothetical protein DBP01_12500, partial [gamma proteobacterium symbiont of Ctena orbiculata]